MSESAEIQDPVFLHAMGLMKDGEDGSGEICKTLKRNGITDIIGIFALNKIEIEALDYKEKGKTSKLNRGQLSMICILSAYNTKHIRAGVPLKVLDWLTITHEMFDEFRILYNPAEYFVVPATTASSTTGTPPSNPSRTPPFDPIQDFKRRIKRDPSMFPVLKDSKQWDPWYVDTKAQA